jgi:hypothetical protein
MNRVIPYTCAAAGTHLPSSSPRTAVSPGWVVRHQPEPLVADVAVTVAVSSGAGPITVVGGLVSSVLAAVAVDRRAKGAGTDRGNFRRFFGGTR